MRIEIKTSNKRVTDKDVRSLYIIEYALSLQSKVMQIQNLKYFADKLGYELKKNDSTERNQ